MQADPTSNPEAQEIIVNQWLAISPCPICEVWGDRNHAADCPNG